MAKKQHSTFWFHCQKLKKSSFKAFQMTGINNTYDGRKTVYKFKALTEDLNK